MRTLILTSEGTVVFDKIQKLLPAPANMLKLALIVTASKGEDDPSYSVTEHKKLENVGFNVFDVDIEGMTEREAYEALKEADVIYVQGGNTFYLLKAMQECNFAEVIRHLLDNGAIYIGVSAGTIVAGPDIKPSTWPGDNNHVDLKDLTGLFLVPFGIFVHYTGKFSEAVGREIFNAPYKVKFLKDDELLFVQDDKVEQL